MSQEVVIKSNKYGINLILDKDISFVELKKAVLEKFRESEKFFKNAKLAISFEGRRLTQEEERQIIDLITDHTTIEIICVLDHDSGREEETKRQIDAYYELVESGYGAALANKGEFYKGTLRSGQVLESEASITVIGDVNPGAKVISEGNIVILGALKGNAYAGCAGNCSCFIIALDMNPIQIQIGNVLAKSPDEKKPARHFRKRERAAATVEPQIATTKDGMIYIEPVTKGILNNI